MTRIRQHDDEDLPLDDSTDFPLARRQAELRKVTATRKVVEHMWAEILGPLRSESTRQSYVT